MLAIKSSMFILSFVFCFLHSCDAIRLESTSLDIWKKLPRNKMPQRNGDIVMSSKHEDVDAQFLKNNGLKATKSGSEDGSEYADEVKLVHAKTSMDSIRRPRQNSKERVLHSSDLSYKDLMQTDYQPPHRKSPIHNK